MVEITAQVPLTLENLETTLALYQGLQCLL